MQKEPISQYSKWSILSENPGARQNPLYRCQAFRIVYLDDHRIFRTGLKKSCIFPNFPNAAVLEFTDGDEAFCFITEQLSKDKRIDLVLTDINHPGLKGDQFIEKIQDWEKLQGRMYRIPIVVISMIDDKNIMNKLTNPSDPLISRYFHKSAEVGEILQSLEKILL